VKAINRKQPLIGRAFVILPFILAMLTTATLAASTDPGLVDSTAQALPMAGTIVDANGKVVGPLGHSTIIPQGLVFNANNGYGQVRNLFTGPTGAPAPDFWLLVPWNPNGLGYGGLPTFTYLSGDQLYFPVSFVDADSSCQVPPGSTSTPPYMLPTNEGNKASNPYSVTMDFGGEVALFPDGQTMTASALGIGATNDVGFGNCHAPWVTADEKFAPAVALDLGPLLTMFTPPFKLTP
jgi:hypothetical protein